MKTIKFLLWLIILALLTTLIYQNIEYFTAGTTLKLDLKVQKNWNWQLPELINGAFFGICFLIGLFLTGIKAVSIKLRLNRKIRDLELRMAEQISQINELNTRLDVFTHDPYIKKELGRNEKKIAEQKETAPLKEKETVTPEKETDESDNA